MKNINKVQHLFFSSLLVAIILGCSDVKTTVKYVKTYTPEQFTKNKRVSGLTFSKNGSKLLFSSSELGEISPFYYDLNNKTITSIFYDSTKPIWALSFIPNNESDYNFIFFLI